MAVYDHSGDINSTQLDPSRKRKARSRRDGTTVAERLQLWKDYNETTEEASPKKRKRSVSDVMSTSSQSEVCTAGTSGRVHVKTEDGDFDSEASPLEDMKKEVKVDANASVPSSDWLSEFEQKYWNEVLEEKEKQKKQEIEETCQKQPGSLSVSVSDYGWPEDLNQSQWDSSEMFDVSELLGDLNCDIFTGLDQVSYPLDNVAGGLPETEKLQGLDSSYGLPPFQLEAQDGNEFFDLSFLDLEK